MFLGGERHAVLVRRRTALHRGRDAAGRRRRHDDAHRQRRVVVGRDGAIYSYGRAGYIGGASPSDRNAAAIAAAAGGGYWIAMVPRPPSGPPAPPNSGSGRRIVYSNSGQRVWLVEADNTYAHTFLVSGRRGVPAPGTYRGFSKSASRARAQRRAAIALHDPIRRGALRARDQVHGIPLRRNGTPIQGGRGAGRVPQRGLRPHEPERHQGALELGPRRHNRRRPPLDQGKVTHHMGGSSTSTVDNAPDVMGGLGTAAAAWSYGLAKVWARAISVRTLKPVPPRMM